MKRILLSLFAAAALLFGGLAPAQVATDAGKTGIARAAHLLCSSAVAASVTGTTNETALATCTVPAGAMGLNGGLHIYSTWTTTSSANTKTMRIRLGGIAGSSVMNAGVTATSVYGDVRKVRNRNSASSQVMGNPAASNQYGAIAAAVSTAAVDTSVNVDLVLSGTLTNTGETITLESYEVWLIP